MTNERSSMTDEAETAEAWAERSGSLARDVLTGFRRGGCGYLASLILLHAWARSHFLPAPQPISPDMALYMERQSRLAEEMLAALQDEGS